MSGFAFFSPVVFCYMRQFLFDFYCFFAIFWIIFFLNGFPNSFIVHSRRSSFVPNFPFCLEVFVPMRHFKL